MTKQVFLNELREALTGEVSSEVIMDTYRYYSDYIDEEVRGGKSEEEVIEELGKPFMIARSIITAQSGMRDADIEYTEDGRTRKIHGNRTKREQKGDSYVSGSNESKEFHFDFNAWYAKVLYIAIIIVLVVIVFFVLKIGFFVLVTFGIPILIVLGIVYLFVLFFSKL